MSNMTSIKTGLSMGIIISSGGAIGRIAAMIPGSKGRDSMILTVTGSTARIKPAMRLSRLAAILCVLAVSGCEMGNDVPDGRIKVLNHLSGDQYSTLEVSAGGSYVLKSKEWVLLPRGTTSIYFRYQGEKSTREYRVECPANPSRGITLKLIDVHSNRMPGGCETVWYNRQ